MMCLKKLLVLVGCVGVFMSTNVLAEDTGPAQLETNAPAAEAGIPANKTPPLSESKAIPPEPKLIKPVEKDAPPAAK
jgi:hypothetical protein